MDVERIFSADQIEVPPDLARILREYTKAVIRENPADITEFSWKYFKAKVEAQDNEEIAKLAGGMRKA
jgi:hypothetical protein